MDDNKRRLYDALSSEYDMGTFEQFVSDIKDDAKRKRLYDAVSTEYDLGDYDSFSKQLFQGEAQQIQAPTSERTPNYTATTGDYTQPTEAQRNFEERGNFEPIGQGSVELKGQDVPVLVGAQGQFRVPSPVKLDEQQEIFRHGNPSEAEVREYTNRAKSKQAKETDEERRILTEEIDSRIADRLRRYEKEVSMPTGGVSGGMVGVPQSYFTAEADEEVQVLRAAQDLMNQSRIKRNKYRRKDDGFASNVMSSMGEKAIQKSTWDFGATDMNTALQLYKASEKEDRGEELTENEQLLMDAAVNNAITQAVFEAESKGAFAGEMAVDMIPFVMQIVANPISGLGKAASSKVSQIVAKRILRMPSGAIRRIAMKVAPRGAALVAGLPTDLAAGAGMAVTTNAMNTAADALQRMNNGEETGTAVTKAILNQGVEFASENTGRFFSPLFNGIGKIVGKGVAKVTPNAVANAAKDIANKGYSRQFKELLKAGRWDGFLEENAEEIAGGLMNAALVGDRTVEEVFSKDNIIDTAIGLSVAGVLLPAVATGNYAIAKFKERGEALLAEKEAAAVFGDRWPQFRQAIVEAKNSDNLGDAIASLYQAEGKNISSREETKALYDYARAYYAYNALKGINPEKVAYMSDEYKAVVDNFTAGETMTPEELQAASMESGRAMEELARLTGMAADELAGIGVEDALNRADEAEANGDMVLGELWRSYIRASANLSGNERAVKNQIEQQSAASDAEVDALSNNGMIVSATLRGGENVNIVGGNVVLNGDGSINEEASDKQLIVVLDGERKSIGVASIGSVDGSVAVDEEKARRRAAIEEEARRQQMIDRGDVHVFTPGETFSTPMGEVQFVEDNGDGTASVVVNGANTVVSMEGLNNLYSQTKQAEYNASKRAEGEKGLNGEKGSEGNGQQPNVVQEPVLSPAEQRKQKRAEVAKRIPTEGKKRLWTMAKPEDVAEYISLLESDPAKQAAMVDGYLAEIAEKQAKLSPIEAAELNEDVEFWNGVKGLLGVQAENVARENNVVSKTEGIEAEVVEPAENVSAPAVEDVRATNEMQPAEEQSGEANEMVEEAAAESDISEDNIMLSEEEAENLIAQMKYTAESARELELTPEAWEEEFGEEGVMESPIGAVKMGENQYFKLLKKKRAGYFGMIKPTLTNPDVVLEEYDPKDGAERQTKYLFVKTFVKADGSRYVHFESVTVLKETLEVSISSHEVNEDALKRKMQQCKLLHLNSKFLNSEGRLIEPLEEGSDLVPTPNSVSSESKDTPQVSNEQENEQKSGEIGNTGVNESVPDNAESVSESAESVPEATKKTEESSEKDIVDELRERNENAKEREQRAGFPPRPSDYVDAISKEDATAAKEWEDKFNAYLQKLGVADLLDIDGTISNMQGLKKSIKAGNPKGYKENPNYKAFDYIEKALKKRRKQIESAADSAGGAERGGGQSEVAPETESTDLGSAPQVEEETSNESNISQESEQVGEQDAGPVNMETLQLNMSEEDFNALLNSGDEAAISEYLAELDDALRMDENSPFAGEMALRDEYKNAVQQYGKENIPAEVMADLEKRMKPYSDLSRAIYDRKYALEDKLRELESAAEKATAAKEKEIKVENKNTAFGGFFADKTDLGASTAEKALNKKYNFDGKVMTVAEFVENAVANGDAKLSTIEEPKYKGASRAAWNRMDAKQQEEDAKKVKESGTKTVYTVNDHDLGKTAYDYAKFLLDKKTEQEKVAEKEKESERVERIEDVGEKIGGAKKDKLRETIDRMKADMEQSDETLIDKIAKLPTSKIFNFDFQKLREGGMPNEAISFMEIVKESIPAKPRASHKVRRWVNNTLALYKLCLEVGTNWDRVNTILTSRDFAGTDLKAQFDAYMSVGGFDSGLNIGNAKLKQLDKTAGYYKDGKFISSEGKWYVRDAGKHGGIYDTKEEAVEALKAFAGDNAGTTESGKKKEVKFAVYQRREDKSIFIAIKGKSDIVIQDGFKSAKEAFDYIEANNAELQSRYRNLLDKTNADFEENRERKGRDYRNGKDITAEEFRTTFGFRGVEFGNWMTQEDRRKAINECYDALMDLAAVCKVSPKALSLNGTLGMAFGSRGGGKFSAHYEPGKVVINLTKTRGAGTLAHEWFHAMDNYFAKMGETEFGYATGGEGMLPKGIQKYGKRYYDRNSGRVITEEEYNELAKEHTVRREMVDAWEYLMESLKESDYYKRSNAYARLHNSKYWNDPTELGARAFSVWVENELSKQDTSNDYLANNPRYVKSEVTDAQDKYMPYPFDTDADWMDEAFGNLFEVMQERETEDGNVALYQRGSLSLDTENPAFEAATKNTVEAVKKTGVEVEEATPEMVQAVLGGMQAEKQIVEATNERFNRELDAFKEKKHSGLLHLGAPMGVLSAAGVNARELTLSPTVLHQHLKKHNLTTDDLKGLAEAIQSPILVYRHGETRPNLVVVTELNVNGGKLSIALKLDANGNVVEVSNVSSVHSKDGVKELERLSLLDENKLRDYLRWVEKEKVSDWLGLPYEEERQDANPKLVSVANVINSFENPKIETEFLRTSDGTVYGWAVNGKIFLTPEGMNPNTPAHEYTHLWAAMIEKNDPKLWSRIVEVMKESPTWNEVLLDEAYRDIHNNDSRMASEVLSRLSGEENYRRAMELAEREIKDADGIIEKAKKIALWGRIKQALADFWASVKGVFGFKDKAPWTEFVDMALGDLYAGVNPNAVGSPLERMFIGERGASNLDRAEEASLRLDNLNVAREMEEAGKGAKAIKLATGWERGADGKWRYEVMDDFAFDMSGNVDYGKRKPESLKEYNRYKELLHKKNALAFEGEELPADELAEFKGLEVVWRGTKLHNSERLKDFIDAPELFEAYPELRNVAVRFDDLGDNVFGQYSVARKEITINPNHKEVAIKSALAHEIQHAIQHIEGFAKGGNTESVRTKAQELRRDVRPLYEMMLETPEWAEKQRLQKRWFDETDDAKIAEIEARVEEIDNSGVLKGIEALQAELQKKYGLDRTVGRIISSPYAEDAEIWNELPDSFNDRFEAYRSLAGEVESRNVQSRMGMTEEERRNSLAVETEDVAREDQVFIEENLGVSKMGSRVDKRMADVAEQLKDRELTPEQQAVVDVFSGKSDNLPISVKTQGGNVRKIVMRQGNEAKAGAKHSLYRHYGTGVGSITSEDIALIPHVLENGVRSEDGKKIVYELEKDGTVYKIITEKNSRGAEVFDNFYTNKNGNARSSNTQLSAQADSNTASADKDTENISNAQEEDTSFRPGEGAYSDEEVTFENDPVSKMLGKPRGTKAQRREFAERKRMREAVDDVASALNTPIEVLESTEGLTGRRAKAKGWYEKSTGRIIVVLPNNRSVADVMQTVLHEAVAHYGLRKLFGVHFDDFIDNIYNNVDAETRRKINLLASRNGWNLKVATEEYLASLAEDANFERVNPSLWKRIKSFFLDMLAKAGVRLDFELTDDELRYILYRSYQNLKNPGRYRTIAEEAKDIAMQSRLKVGNYAENALADVNVAEDDILMRSPGQSVAQTLYDKETAGFVNDFVEGWQNRYRSLQALMNAIEKETGKKIADFANVFLNMEHLPARNRVKMDSAMRKYVEPLMAIVNDFAKMGVSQKELERYLNSKHGLERNREMAVADACKSVDADGKTVFDSNKFSTWEAGRDAIYAQGMSWADTEAALDALAKTFGVSLSKDYSGLTAIYKNRQKGSRRKAAYDAVVAFESKAGNELIDELWKRVKAINDFSLSESFSSGLMAKDTYDRLTKRYRYYVPLRGFNEKAVTEYEYVSSTDFPMQGINKTAHGRRSEAADIFPTMMNMMESAVVLGNRNRAKLALLHLAEQYPTKLLTVSNSWYSYNDVNDTWVPVAHPQLTPNMTPEEIADTVNKWETDMRELEKQGKAKRFSTSLQIDKLGLETWKQDEHSVKVRRNGKEYVVWVNGNPKAAQAINGILGVQSQDTSKFFQLSERANRWRANNITSRNPEFVFSNLARDVQQASKVSFIKFGFKYLRDFERNLWRNSIPKIHRLYYLYSKDKLNMNDPTHKMFYEFMQAGSETGFITVMSIEDYQKKIDKLVSPTALDKAGKPIKVVRDTFNTATELANRGVENACRFAAFMTSRQAGRSLLESVNDAKEVSLNFDRKGSGAYGNMEARQMKMFLNPTIQGLAQQITLIKEHPARAIPVTMAELAMGYFAGQAAVYLFNWIASLFTGDDDEKYNYSYYNIPEFVRRNSLIIPTGREVNDYIVIPLSHEQRVAYGIGEILGAFKSGHMDAEDVPTAIMAQAAQMLPMNPFDAEAFIDPNRSAWENFIKTVSPDILVPGLEAVFFNENFAGMRITNQSDYNKHLPEYKRALKDTPKYMVELSKFINEASGGTSGKKGWADSPYTNNPAVWEHLMKSYLGGIYAIPNKATKTILGFWDEDFREPKNWPIIGKFYMDTSNYEQSPEERTRRDYENAYYKIKDKYEAVAKELTTYRKELVSTDEEVANEARKNLETTEGSIYNSRFVGYFKSVEKMEKRLKDALNEAKESKEKELVDELEQRLLLLKKEAVNYVETLEELNRQ